MHSTMSRIAALALAVTLSALLPAAVLAAPTPQILAAAHADAGEPTFRTIQSRQCLPVGGGPPPSEKREDDNMMMMMMMMDGDGTDITTNTAAKNIAAVDCADLEARQMYHGAKMVEEEADGGVEVDRVAVEGRQMINFMMDDGEAVHGRERD